MIGAVLSGSVLLVIGTDEDRLLTGEMWFRVWGQMSRSLLDVMLRQKDTGAE